MQSVAQILASFPLGVFALMSSFRAQRLLGQQASGFVHQFVLESAGVGVERGGLDPEPAARAAPGGYGGEDFAQDAFGGVSLDPKAVGNSQRSMMLDSSRSSLMGVLLTRTRSISGTGFRS